MTTDTNTPEISDDLSATQLLKLQSRITDLLCKRIGESAQLKVKLHMDLLDLIDIESSENNARIAKALDLSDGRDSHVDYFIEFGGCRQPDTPHTVQARWFFMLFRLSASLKQTFKEQMGEQKLFCVYKGKRYRVNGCSRMGDIWLHSNFSKNCGYEHRVFVHDVSNFSTQP